MSVSLDSAIRTCKVNTGWATREESDRFLNPNNMLCPLWNGLDNTGRRVCPDSFVTKSRGCNSATDRVVVENNVSRPQYIEYITLNSAGVAGNIYGPSDLGSQVGQSQARRVKEYNSVPKWDSIPGSQQISCNTYNRIK
tara:strand:+ start:224 stop:640 length:417 start_codon:yes stop_codon:yes gene_type:complete